jgi:signal transduction histidine kinase
MTLEEKHQRLLASARQSERDLREALANLRRAVHGLGPAEHIRRQPLPWLFSGLLVGLWLGSRR